MNSVFLRVCGTDQNEELCVKSLQTMQRLYTNQQSIALTSVNVTLEFLQKYTQRADGAEFKSTLGGGEKSTV